MFKNLAFTKVSIMFPSSTSQSSETTAGKLLLPMKYKVQWSVIRFSPEPQAWSWLFNLGHNLGTRYIGYAFLFQRLNQENGGPCLQYLKRYYADAWGRSAMH